MRALPRTAGARLILVSLVLLVALGCKGVTPIKKLLDDPSEYEGKDVRIAGVVKSSVGVLNYGTYRVDDGTGSILVVTQVSGVPREGARVGVEGVFRSAFTIGTETAAVLMEKKHKLE